MEQQKPTGTAQNTGGKPQDRTGKTGRTGTTKRNSVNKAYRQERITQVLTHSNNKDINLYQTRGENP